jgi:hypothetical protein
MEQKKVKKLNDLEVLKKLFNAVTENDILIVHGPHLYYRNNKVSAEVKAKLISDANLLKTMDLWNILLDCMRYEANKAIYDKAVDSDSLIFPKAMLFAIDIFEKKVNNLAKFT